jgi:hypothetical protein
VHAPQEDSLQRHGSAPAPAPRWVTSFAPAAAQRWPDGMAGVDTDIAVRLSSSIVSPTSPIALDADQVLQHSQEQELRAPSLGLAGGLQPCPPPWSPSAAHRSPRQHHQQQKRLQQSHHQQPQPQQQQEQQQCNVASSSGGAVDLETEQQQQQQQQERQQQHNVDVIVGAADKESAQQQSRGVHPSSNPQHLVGHSRKPRRQDKGMGGCVPS